MSNQDEIVPEEEAADAAWMNIEKENILGASSASAARMWSKATSVDANVDAHRTVRAQITIRKARRTIFTRKSPSSAKAAAAPCI